MTWTELRELVDNAIKESGASADEVEVWYVDSQAIQQRRAEVHIGDPHHPGHLELWID